MKKKKIRFKKEYYLQKVTNKNLNKLFDLKLITAEFQFENQRFDGLAYDEKDKSFVIIEYKNKKDFEVLNQAKSYYELLLDNHQEYIDKYNEKFKTDLKEEDFDFEKTRIMIIGPEFSNDQIESSKNPDYPFELFTATLYQCDDENGCVLYQKVNEDFNKKLKINLDDLKITEEILLDGKSSEMTELYHNLKDNILKEFGDVEIRYLVDQFSLRADDKLLCLVRFLKSSFNIYIYAESLENADKTTDISESRTGGSAKYQLKYESDDDYEYFLNLFKQTYSEKVEK